MWLVMCSDLPGGRGGKGRSTQGASVNIFLVVELNLTCLADLQSYSPVTRYKG